jgi:hypothetical protein
VIPLGIGTEALQVDNDFAARVLHGVGAWILGRVVTSTTGVPMTENHLF